MKLTAVGSGYFIVSVNGADVSNHTTEREAIESAANRELASPADEVRYRHDYVVWVEQPSQLPQPSNLAPVWQTVPTVMFAQGLPSSVSIVPYVTDPDGDALTITKNAAALPAGVTFDSAGKRFIYDGIGVAVNTSGHVLTANDGRA